MMIFAVLLFGIVAAAVVIRARAPDRTHAPRGSRTRPGAMWVRLGAGDRVVLVALGVALLLITTMALYVVVVAFT